MSMLEEAAWDVPSGCTDMMTCDVKVERTQVGWRMLLRCVGIVFAIVYANLRRDVRVKNLFARCVCARTRLGKRIEA